jgi:hypothetical protein
MLVDTARIKVFALLGCLAFPILSMGQAFDTTPPTLLNFSFTPSKVDVTAGPETVTLNLHVTDNLSGLFGQDSFVNVGFTSPSGNQNQQANLSVTVLPGSTSLNVNYQATITIPQYSESGNWTASVTMSDADGNVVTLSASELASMFFPSVLMVTSVPDTTPPTLTGLSITPSSINVSNGPQSVTFSLSLTDSQSGVAFPCQPFCSDTLQFIGPTGDQILQEYPYNVHLKSGTIKAGVWEVTVTFPQYAAPGNWNFELAVSDSVGNFAFLGPLQLQNLGLPTTVQVSSTPSDSTPPVLTGLSITPLVINTSTGPQTITIGLGLTDNLSGVDFTAGSLALTPDSGFGASFFTVNFELLQGAVASAYFEEFGSNGLPLTSPNFNTSVIVFTSPSGQQTQVVNPYHDTFTKESGTPQNGQWQVTTTLPQYSEGGTWALQYLTVQDGALNGLFLDQAKLQALNFPSSFVVYQPSLTPDGTVTPTSSGPTTIDDTVFGSRASLTFPAGEVSVPTTVSIDVLNTALNVPTPVGFSANPATFFTNIQLNPEPNFPLPAPGLTLVLPLANPMSAGTVLSLYRIDPATGLPTAAQNLSGANIQGFVDATGLSATFMGISRLSTAVAYLPLPGTVLGDVNEDGKVNCADMAIVKADFGQKKGQPGYNTRADLNQDGVINILDLAIVARQLPPGLTCP